MSSGASPRGASETDDVDRQRRALLLWISGLIALVVLVLAITGTLDSWTDAIGGRDRDSHDTHESGTPDDSNGLSGAPGSVHSNGGGTSDRTDNSDDSDDSDGRNGPGAAANPGGSMMAVALSEADGSGTVCKDTATESTNTAICTSINKYGGTAAPLTPGGPAPATAVRLTNTGVGPGHLVLSAGQCTGGAICDYVSVTVECPDGATKYGPQALNVFANAGQVSIKTGLAAGEEVGCVFSIQLSSNAPASVAGETASQILTWTLTAI